MKQTAEQWALELSRCTELSEDGEMWTDIQKMVLIIKRIQTEAELSGAAAQYGR